MWPFSASSYITYIPIIVKSVSIFKLLALMQEPLQILGAVKFLFNPLTQLVDFAQLGKTVNYGYFPIFTHFDIHFAGW